MICHPCSRCLERLAAATVKIWVYLEFYGTRALFAEPDMNHDLYLDSIFNFKLCGWEKIMLDLHCHILPGMDDGPTDMAESLRMAARAVADGISAVVATPHAGNGVFNNRPKEILAGVERLRLKLREAGIPLQVYPGAEVHLMPQLGEMVNGRQMVTINHGRYLLLELPEILLVDSCKAELFNLRMQGIVPIIVHPERHAYFQKHQESLLELLEMGMLCQVTAQSLLGDFGGRIQKCAEQMVRNRHVQVLASDAHGAEHRVPALAEAVKRAAGILGNREEAEDMASATPRAIVADREIKSRCPSIAPRGLGRRMSRAFDKMFVPAAKSIR